MNLELTLMVLWVSAGNILSLLTFPYPNVNSPSLSITEVIKTNNFESISCAVLYIQILLHFLGLVPLFS